MENHLVRVVATVRELCVLLMTEVVLQDVPYGAKTIPSACYAHPENHRSPTQTRTKWNMTSPIVSTGLKRFFHKFCDFQKIECLVNSVQTDGRQDINACSLTNVILVICVKLDQQRTNTGCHSPQRSNFLQPPLTVGVKYLIFKEVDIGWSISCNGPLLPLL